MKSGIYKIRNISNDECYIGSAVNFNKRWQLHLYELNNNCHHSLHMQRAWNKYSQKSFRFEIIEKCEKTVLIEREQYYLDYLKPEYNICRQAKTRLGLKCSKETRKRMSIAHTGKLLSKEHREKMSAGRKGLKSALGKHWKLSDITKEKMSKAQIGRKMSEETKRKISKTLREKL